MHNATRNEISELVLGMTLAFGGAEDEPDEADFRAAEIMMGRSLNRCERRVLRRNWAEAHAEAGWL